MEVLFSEYEPTTRVLGFLWSSKNNYTTNDYHDKFKEVSSLVETNRDRGPRHTTCCHDPSEKLTFIYFSFTITLGVQLSHNNINILKRTKEK